MAKTKEKAKKEKELSVDEIAKIVSDLSDKHGINASDVSRFDDILSEGGLTKEQVTKEVILSADNINRLEFQKIVRKLGTNRRQEAAKEEKAEAKKPSKKGTSEKATNRATVFGEFSVSAIANWMGQHKWDYEQATKVLAKLGVKEVKESTVKTGLSDGRSEKYRKKVPLSKEQVAKLNELRPAKPKDEAPAKKAVTKDEKSDETKPAKKKKKKAKA